LGVSPVLRALQEKAAAIQETTLDSLLRKLPELDDRQIKVIRKLTKSIVNQVIHDPILRIKELAADKRSDEALKLFVQLFALENEVEHLKAEEKAEEKFRKETAASAKASDSSPNSVLDIDNLLSQLASALR
jgi:glutamyl-tRNA reductase